MGNKDLKYREYYNKIDSRNALIFETEADYDKAYLVNIFIEGI